MANSAPQGQTVEALIDGARAGNYQRLVILLTGLAVIMDGFDNQLLALAIPSLMNEWGLPRETFAYVASLGLVGMSIGTMVGGMLGDRLGRKPLLIASVMLFGAATAVIAFVNDVPALIAMRFIGGLGLGAAMPNAAALIGEFTPARQRSIAVTIGLVCSPLGALLAGLVGAAILPVYGWRAMFVLGGVAPALIALIQIAFLPESPRFLAARQTRSGELNKILARMGVTVEAPLEVSRQDSAEKRSIRELFSSTNLRDTLALWAAFFFVFLVITCYNTWLPSMLTDVGLSVQQASSGMASVNAGSVVGALLASVVTAAVGSRIPTMSCALVGAAGALFLSFMAVTQASPILFAMLALEGVCMAGVQIMLYSVAFNIYSTPLRATGIGWSVGVGRLGAVVAPVVASTILAVNGNKALFLIIAASMGIIFISLAAISRHMPAAAR